MRSACSRGAMIRLFWRGSESKRKLEREQERLDNARDLRAQSRTASRVAPAGAGDAAAVPVTAWRHR